MSRVVVLLFLVYYSMGTLLFPMGDLTYVRDLPQMYHRCAAEDPDMDLPDFVVEHIMNIQDGDEHEANEKPHQPVYSHSPVQLLVTFASKIKIVNDVPEPKYFVERTYPIARDQNISGNYAARILRPPITA